MKTTSLYFVYPGCLNILTGGYHYDRRLVGELRTLGLDLLTISLPDRFPFPDGQALEETRQALATLPDGAVVIIDGLALGALDALVEAEAERLRIIALCHHPLALESGLDKTQQQALQGSEQRALQSARAVVVTSEHTGRILATRFALPAGRITVAPPGTDRVDFAPCNGAPPTLLCVASLTRRKAHDVLIDALAPLAALPWQARLVGSNNFDPGWTAALKVRVKRHHLQDRIRFIGPVDDLAPEYQGADAFVLTSIF